MAFEVLADPTRRRILDLLRERPRLVGELSGALGLSQPGTSKHLRVLREVGAVRVREHGRQRLYRVNGRALEPIHEWVKRYERSWSKRFDALDDVLGELKNKGDESDGE